MKELRPFKTKWLNDDTRSKNLQSVYHGMINITKFAQKTAKIVTLGHQEIWRRYLSRRDDLTNKCTDKVCRF